MNDTRFIERCRGMALLPVIAAFTLMSAPAHALPGDPVTTTVTTQSSSAAANKQAQAAAKEARMAAKKAQKAAKKAARLAAKKAKICAKKPTKKNAKKLAAKQNKWGCFASSAATTANEAAAVTSPSVADSKPGNGIDPTTLPLLFTPTLGNNGNNASNGKNSNSGNNGDSGNESTNEPQVELSTELPAAVTPTDVPEPGTLGLLGLGLVAIGLARRRKASGDALAR